MEPAHGRHSDYPAQEKPPLEPQELVELLAPENEDPKEANFEIFLSVLVLSQMGQTGFWSESEKRITFSNT
jgi:hypothetical protein